MGDKLKLVRRSGFTTLPNAVVRDPRLNFQAKGLFWLMFSLPDDWEFSIGGLAAVAGGGRGNGKDAVRASLRQLEEAGYLLREQRHDDGGKFTGNTFVLYDESLLPQSLPAEAKAGEKPPLSGFPSTVFPSTEKPSSVFPTVLNKDIQSNTPHNPPKGGRRARSPEWKEAPDWKPERFARFWSFYPREGRKDKQKAIRAWDKLKPDDDTLKLMADALIKLKESDEWQRGIGIPYVSTFLNGHRWLDAESLDVPPDEQDELEEVAVGWR